MSIFQPAVKSKSKLRLAIAALSGAGKTYTALRIATGIAAATGGKIAIIDSEHGSSQKYADRFTFDIAEPFDHSITTYIDLITAAGKDGRILIIDGLTQAWHELCDSVEKVAQAKYRGNTWSAWSDSSTGTPMQRKLIDTIVGYPGHLIATIRVDTEWAQEEDKNGRKRPVKVGLKPSQGKGIEYEFDMLMTMTAEHIAHVEKDRTGKYQDQFIEKPGEEFGQQLVAWLNDAPAPTVVTTTDPLAFTMSKIDLAAGIYKIDAKSVTAIIGKVDSVELAEAALLRIEALGHLYQAITEKGVTPAQIKKALTKLGKSDIVELDIESADKLRAGIEKLTTKAA